MSEIIHKIGANSVSKDVSLKEKWTRLLMDMLGWEEEEDIWSWVGKVRGGWEEQFQVLRSAPLMMMMMDAEEQFKTSWKRRWREAITGDPDRRIRDQMDDREVQKRVKLVDTASFTVIRSCLILLLLKSIVSARNCHGHDSRVSFGWISIWFSLVLSCSQHYVNVIEVRTKRKIIHFCYN